MRKSLLLLFSGISVACATQIKSIDFEGLHYMSKQVATEMSGLRIGDEISGANTNTAIANLFSQGYFNDVYVKQTNGDVLIVVDEKPTIAKIDIEGVVTNDKDAIKNLIGIKAGQMYDEISIAKAKQRIKQFYEVKSFFDTVVDAKAMPLNKENSSVHLLIKINRGENIIIENVNMIGADKLDYSDVKSVVANKEREALGWMWGFYDGKAKTFELPNDANRIRDEYYKRGYLDASVSEPLLNTNKNSYKADLNYYITEGNKYKVSSIDIQTPPNVSLDKEDVIDDFKLEVGDTMNSEWLRRDMKLLEDRVADLGFAYVRVMPQTKQNREDNTVDILYVVVPEEKVYIRNVTISGNDKTEDKVVRREMYLTEGNLYNRTDYTDSINALKRTGYFDSVEIKETRVGKDEIDLEVVVKEAPTGSITGGIGYGSEDGLLLNAGISDSNIFGTGLKGDFIVDKSSSKLSGRIGLTNPRIFDSEYMGGISLYANDYKWDDYNEKSHGFNLMGGRKLGRYTSASLTYVFEKSEIEGLNNFYRAAGYMNGDNIKSSIIPAIMFNNTDDYYIPRSGISASASLEYAGLGGDIKFTKARGNFNWYFGLQDYVGWDLIFRYKAAAGYIWDTGKTSELPINEKLFLGGMRSIRGYESRSIPKEQICLQNQGCRYIEVGGLMSFNNSFELSMPLIERIKMRLVTFFDYGMIGDKDWNESKRYSAGVGIEWMTPVGPLSLYYVEPLKEEKWDKTSNFEFSIGHRFN